MIKILVCDDDKNIAAALRIYLTAEGYEVAEAYDGKQALDILRREDIGLVLIDVMMPVMDGITAAALMRKESNVPIIFLSAKSEDTDKILGLNIGGDDYITKPFNPVEVMARVKSQLRRYNTLGSSDKKSGVIRLGAIELDDEGKTVRVDGEGVFLTPTEYEILKLLLDKPGRVLSSREIYSRIWNDSAYGAENTVAVHIRHLREKIEINPAEPRYLKVVWGQGYKIEPVKEGRN